MAMHNYKLSSSTAVTMLAALLACTLIASTHAELILYAGTNGEFPYDGDEYYQPGDGSQVAAGRPDSTTGPFQFYSNFNTNGATIKSIQSCVSNSHIQGLIFTWSDSTSNTIGQFDCGSDKRYFQFDITNGERISLLEQEGDNGVLCKFYIETTIGEGILNSMQFGGANCGGDKGPTTAVGSGILAGAFGYANPSGGVFQLGLFMLKQISSVTQDTAQFSNFPTDGNGNTIVPVNTYKGGYTIGAIDANVGQTGKLTYYQATGYDSQYAASTTTTNAFGMAVGVSMSYASTTPVNSAENNVSVDTKYDWSKSQTTSSSYKVTGTESTNLTLNVCCPPGFDCSWSTYQAMGQVTATKPADAEIETRVTFVTGTIVTYKSSTTWSGASSYPTVFLVLQTNPPPESGTPINDVADYCNSAAGRRLLSGSKAKEYEFAAVYKVPETTTLSKVVKKLNRYRVTKENLYIHNPFLRKIGMNGTVVRGQKLSYTFKDVAFVQELPVRGDQ